MNQLPELVGMPETLRDHLKALVPFMVDISLQGGEMGLSGFIMQLLIPEEMWLSYRPDHKFMDDNKLTVDEWEENPMDWSRDYITIPEKRYRVDIQYN